MKSMEEHFSLIADKYNDIRTTDREPIEHIRDLFSNYERCVAVDVGCGPGRYALLLLQMMPQLHLICLDRNSDMVAETTRLLRGANINRFKATIADASEFPLDPNSIDVVFTFNAVHHFTMPAFLREARKVLKKTVQSRSTLVCRLRTKTAYGANTFQTSTRLSSDSGHSTVSRRSFERPRFGARHNQTVPVRSRKLAGSASSRRSEWVTIPPLDSTRRSASKSAYRSFEKTSCATFPTVTRSIGPTEMSF